MISKRIKEIVKLVPPYRRICDVGCDHGYLVMEAFDQGLIDFAQLVDNKEMPLLSAKSNLKDYNKDSYELSLSNGISELRSDIPCVCILGMGGVLICDILKDTKKRTNIKRLILQPNKNSFEVRCFLMENGYKITFEEIIYDKKYYEVIVAEVGTSNYSNLELKYGPINLKKKSLEFKNYLEYKISLLKRINNKKVLEKIKEMEDLLWK